MAAVHRRRRGHRLRARGDPTWNHGTDSRPVMHRGRAGRMGAGHGRDDEGGGVHSCSNVGMGLVRRGGHRCAGSHTLWIVMGLCRSRTAGERGGIARVSFSETGSRAVIRAVLLHRATHGRLTRIFACATATCIGFARSPPSCCGCTAREGRDSVRAVRSDDEGARRPTRAVCPFTLQRATREGAVIPAVACRELRAAAGFPLAGRRPSLLRNAAPHRGPGSRFRTSPTSRRQSSTMRFTAA